MKKIVGFALIGVFVAAFAVGALVATAPSADAAQCIATYKCIHSDTYLCYMCPPTWQEVCVFHHTGCP